MSIADRLSLEHCRSCVCEVSHSNTDVMTPVAWLCCHSRVRLPFTSTEAGGVPLFTA